MKRADFQAYTNQGVWAKSEAIGRSEKEHLWKAYWYAGMAGYAISECCMVDLIELIVVADHGTPRCKRCEAAE